MTTRGTGASPRPPGRFMGELSPRIDLGRGGGGNVNWLTEHPVLAWLGVGLILGAVEVITLDLLFLAFAVAAVAGAVTAGVGGGFAVQVIVVVAVAFVTVGLMRPFLLRRLNRQTTEEHLTNTAALVGRDVLATTLVDAHSGQVKLAGEVWSARTRPGEPVLAEGEHGRVEAIDGATAIVTRAATP